MNNFTLFRIRLRQQLASFCCVALSLLAIASSTQAQAQSQSQDISLPTPVSTNEINGQITVRDIGDARVTRHFYILTGTPGDLVFTVTSNNLNGDVDLFTAGSLRPLGKVSMYAGATPTSVGKTIFLRQRESLILRVEARSPNDNEGTYSIRFAGTFEPVLAATTSSEESAPDSTPDRSDRSDRNVRRVTSSGARIEEPETTARTETTATPADAESTGATSPSPAEPATKPEPSRQARTRRPGRRRIRVNPQPRTTSEPSTETGSNGSSPSDATINPRLIIETRDGMRSERFMSTVRSVTVENGQIVIVSRERGKSLRIPLSTVLKMSIEP